jgi:hypothetical protein
VSLADARQQRDGIRKLLAQNINPAQQRSAERATSRQKKPSSMWHWTGIKQQNMVREPCLPSACQHEQSFFPVIGHACS